MISTFSLHRRSLLSASCIHTTFVLYPGSVNSLAQEIDQLPYFPFPSLYFSIPPIHRGHSTSPLKVLGSCGIEIILANVSMTCGQREYFFVEIEHSMVVQLPGVRRDDLQICPFFNVKEIEDGCLCNLLQENFLVTSSFMAFIVCL